MFYLCQICGDHVPDIYDRWALSIKDEKCIKEIKGHKSCIDSIDSDIQQLNSEHKGKRKMTVTSIFKALGMDIDMFPSLHDVKLKELKEE